VSLRFARGRGDATDSEKKNLQSTHQTEERAKDSKEGENKPYDSKRGRREVAKKKIVRNNNLRERF